MVYLGNVVILGDGYDVIDCEMCGFKYVMLFLDKFENEIFYCDSYYDDGE